MSKVPLPRFSNLGANTPGEAPTTWEGLYKSAQELKAIRDATFPLLEGNKQGFVSLHFRPALSEVQKELERAASKQFGLLGRLALCKPTPAECGTDLLPLPAMVLAFAVHSAILNAGFVCTGSASSDFSETESWPNVLPKGWLDDSGSKYSFRYRARSGASDRLVWKAVLMTDLLAISANDPYSSGKDAMTMHLRIKDFVKSKAGEAPALIDAKEKELNSVIEERIIPIGNPRRSPQGEQAPGYFFGVGGAPSGPGAGPDNRGPAVGGGPAGGFGGDLMPGGGGSMLYGPGNPQFDARFQPQQIDPRTGRPIPGTGGRVPDARFDPYGPFGNGTMGDPDPDEFMMPGNNPMNTFPTGPTGPRRSGMDFGGGFGGGPRRSGFDYM